MSQVPIEKKVPFLFHNKSSDDICCFCLYYKVSVTWGIKTPSTGSIEPLEIIPV